MSEHILVETDGHVLKIGINRPEKKNAFTLDMIHALGQAYAQLDKDENLRVGLVYSTGSSFTTGLDLPQVAPAIAKSGVAALIAPDAIDPFGNYTNFCRKPIVFAVKGHCFTVAIELILAGEICIAAEDCDFAQIETQRGIIPFGGATLRMPLALGWHKAMQYILAGDHFTAAEAKEMGLVNEVVPVGQEFDVAMKYAQRIAAGAPMAVQAALANARLARAQGPAAAIADFAPSLAKLLVSQDVQEGVKAMMEKRAPKFTGK